MNGLLRRLASRSRLMVAVVVVVLGAGMAVAVWAFVARSGPSDGAPGVTAATPAPATTESTEGPVTTVAASRGESASPTAEVSPSAAETQGGADDGSTASASSGLRSSSPTPAPTRTANVSAPSFVVKGAVAKTTSFTVAQLKRMTTVAANYFSRGKDPKETTTAFVGVRLTDILNAAGVSSGASRVTVTASDAYSASFTMRQVGADYVDETNPGVKLPMIIAYSEDGAEYTGVHPFRLVMGQTVSGDYNRQYWVKMIVAITVE